MVYISQRIAIYQPWMVGWHNYLHRIRPPFQVRVFFYWSLQPSLLYCIMMFAMTYRSCLSVIPLYSTSVTVGVPVGDTSTSLMAVVGFSSTSSLDTMNNTQWRRRILVRTTTRHSSAVTKYHHKFTQLLDLSEDEDWPSTIVSYLCLSWIYISYDHGLGVIMSKR